MFDPASIADPRLHSEFDPGHWPLCDGGSAPAIDPQDRFEARKIQFLAIYYRLNQLYSSLHSIRTGEQPGDDRAVLQDIQRTIQVRDALEDLYQAEGFLGEPIMDGMFYKDIEFTYASRREFYEPASSSSFSLYIPMPPPGADVEGWVREHLARVLPVPAAPGVHSAKKAE